MEWGASAAIERPGREENIEFAVPKELRVKNIS
ncbi:MAG: 4-hydroxy-3-methylbut-2-enyl diphosphate reductase [Congregibacter sp.]